MNPSKTVIYQKNLQRAGEEKTHGLWSILSMIDPVSEKKFLSFILNDEHATLLNTAVLAFRSNTAAEICGERCPRVLDINIKETRLEFLTPFIDTLKSGGIAGENKLKELVEFLIGVLARFEALQFEAYDLSINTLGTNENGEYCLLPNAYLLPPIDNDAPVKRQGRGARRGALAARPAGGYSGLGVNLSRFLSVIDSLLNSSGMRTDIVKTSFAAKLSEIKDKTAGGELADFSDILDFLFTDKESRAPKCAAACRGRIPDKDFLLKTSHQIIGSADSGGIVLVEGPALSGKTFVLKSAAEIMESSGGWDCHTADAWELFPKRKRPDNYFSNGRSAFFIDDMDEKAFVYSDIATIMLNGTWTDNRFIVLAVDPGRESRESREFLEKISLKYGDRFIKIALNGPPSSNNAVSKDRVRGKLVSIIRRINENLKLDNADAGGLAGILMAELKDEERQLAEFLAAARFSLPLDFILSSFPQDRQTISIAVHNLAALGLVNIRYRYFPQRESIFVLLSMRHNSLARLVNKNLSADRRMNLSKTFVPLVEEHGEIPRFHYLYHLLKGGEKNQAAAYCVNYFKKHKGDSRPLFFTLFAKNLLENGLFETLPFGGRFFILKELSEDLMAIGDTAQAEKLLLAAADLADEAEFDKQVKNAALIVAAYRMLAGIFECRGEYIQALDLLNNARENLQSCLSLAEQASLLNEIGWLQYRLGDYEKSLRSCKLSLTSLNANQHPLVVSQALNIMGVVHFNTSRYDEAISYYEQSAFLREQAKDFNALSASFNNLGLAYQTKGEYEKALDYYNKSLEIKMKQNNRRGIAGGYLNLAMLNLDMHNFTEAENKCKASIDISRKLGNTQLTAENLSTLGDIALKRGRFEAADEHYLESLQLCKKMGIINEEMGALRRLSSLHLVQGNFGPARRYISKASSLARRIGSKMESAQIDIIKGDLEYSQKHHMKAIKHFEKAASALTTLAKYKQAASALSKIGLIHVEINNTLEARQLMDRALDLAGSEIGRELPEEVVLLQSSLSRHKFATSLPGKASQKLLVAFYELSTLSDFALDRHEFFKRALEIVKQIINPNECLFALKGNGDQFMLYDRSGELHGPAGKAHTALFSKTLLLGCLLESASPDAGDIVSQLGLQSGQGFTSIPMKAMGEYLGCLYMVFPESRLPLSKEDVTFFTSLGRQIAGNLRLLLHFEEHLHKEEQLEKEFTDLKAQFEQEYRFENLIGKSEEMKKIFRTLNKVKNMITGILIIGESGTGKTELARAIHYNSPRANKPFQEIHCGQIPTTLLESELFGHERGAFTGAVQRKLGLCELANGGTIFLDDINVISMETQTKLLHFLESKSFMRIGGTKKITSDVRIIAASNEDLEKLSREKKFREDLYYRLKVLLITIPPLRERKDDILAIALAFLKKKCAEKNVPLKTLSTETIKLFQKTPWRGNVRELQNVLERVVLLSDDSIIHPDSLPEDFLKEISGPGAHRQSSAESLVEEIIGLDGYSDANPLMPQMEALFAKLMVSRAKAKSKAASLLGITKPTLYSRLEKYRKLD